MQELIPRILSNCQTNAKILGVEVHRFGNQPNRNYGLEQRQVRGETTGT